ncbi:immune inhibitor A domain-containing protein [Embleya sp. NPDC055664]|uniref:immune inhibitor A domain-containing protein n=1 Tax=Embleya sp. NPDC059237 TaxID=3346784 RepID=UPI0036ABDF44
MKRRVALLSVSALAITGLAATTAPSTSATPTRVDTTKAVWNPGPEDHYVNSVDAAIDTSALPDDPAKAAALKAQNERNAATKRKNSDGNPRAAAQLKELEAEAGRTGKSPAEIKAERSGKPADATQNAKLLTVLVEFNDQANDDFSGYKRPTSVSDPTCVTEPPGTVKNGPLHNQLPNPALNPNDNNTQWVPNFDQAHYNKMLYSKEGITERMRTDLKGPDGKPGISLAGQTMRNMYEEMSAGKYSVSGEATSWIKVPHSEAWYGAGACGNAQQDNSGSPQNPLGAQQLAIDAVDQLAKSQPSFPWADYDKEDPGDADHDGNTQEPDGVVDHLVLVHAGKDKSAGGGAEGTYAIWAHASTVLFGHQVPGSNIKIANYIVQPEDSGVGVFAHEFGHDLGLPDLYDNFSGGQTDLNFWDLMSAGSHTGPLFQSQPAHMGIWDKYALGWLTPDLVKVGDRPKVATLGQAAKTPKGTSRGIRVNLPNKQVAVGKPHGGNGMWYSGQDQAWSDVRIERNIAVPAGSDVKFWMWNDYVIEQDWDFGFVEVSTDNGATWKQLAVKDEAGALVSTPADYPDPQKNLATFRKTSGLTGSSNGWRHDNVDLTPYAGQNIKLRLDLNTDAAFMEKGWFADDFSLTNGGTTVWSDDVEQGDNGWTAIKGTNAITKGEGWGRTNGTFEREQYYLLEWRNLSGFDEGLKYAYTAGENGKTNRVPYNAPGMLVWLRDNEYQNNGVNFNINNGPSWGPKGELLIVDSHPDPLRFSGDAAAQFPKPDPNTPGIESKNVFGNLGSRSQSANAAFGFTKTTPFTDCIPGTKYCTSFEAQKPVTLFTDTVGWAPGTEMYKGRALPKDRYGSAVVPAKAPYTTKVTKADGTPDKDAFGKLFHGSELGTGNPGFDKGYGVTVLPVVPLPGGSGAVVWILPAQK